MNISLTPELEQFIHTQVEAGRYRSASEAVRDAVRLLREKEQERGARLSALRTAVDVGLTELRRGEGIPADQVFGAMVQRLRDPEAA